MDASRVSVGASHVVPKNKKFWAASIAQACRCGDQWGSARRSTEPL
jgi:hypothetical protein